MRTADTSFLYAYFNEADAHHDEAVRWMRKDAPILVEHGILQETLDLLLYRHGKAAAIAAKDHLDDLPTITYANVPERGAVDKLWRNHKGLSLADAAAAWLAYVEQADLLTFDAEQTAALHSLRSA